jgi:hypothetical protein
MHVPVSGDEVQYGVRDRKLETLLELGIGSYAAESHTLIPAAQRLSTTTCTLGSGSM